MDPWPELHALLITRFAETEANRLESDLHEFWRCQMRPALGFVPEVALYGLNDPSELLHVWIYYLWNEDYDSANPEHTARSRALKDLFRPIEKRRPRGTGLHLEHISPGELLVTKAGRADFIKTIRKFSESEGATFLGELPAPLLAATAI